MTETFFCPRGPGEDSPFRSPMNGAAHWSIGRDGSRTCSYCGSLHPDDALEILTSYAAGVDGYHFSPTDKSYKFYGNRPGVQNASDGGIKFYVHHLPIGQHAEHMAAYHAARERFSAEWRDR